MYLITFYSWDYVIILFVRDRVECQITSFSRIKFNCKLKLIGSKFLSAPSIAYVPNLFESYICIKGRLPSEKIMNKLLFW